MTWCCLFLFLKKKFARNHFWCTFHTSFHKLWFCQWLQCDILWAAISKDNKFKESIFECVILKRSVGIYNAKLLCIPSWPLTEIVFRADLKSFQIQRGFEDKKNSILCHIVSFEFTVWCRCKYKIYYMTVDISSCIHNKLFKVKNESFLLFFCLVCFIGHWEFNFFLFQKNPFVKFLIFRSVYNLNFIVPVGVSIQSGLR